MSLSRQIPNIEQPIIKQEILDAEEIPETSESLLKSVKQELDILQQRAESEITKVFISKPDGFIKREHIPFDETEKRDSLKKSNETDEMAMKVVKDNKSLICTLCDFVASRKSGMAVHQATFHLRKADRVKVKCEHCDVMIYSDRYKAHLKMHLKPTLQCSKCNFRGNRRQLLFHKRRQHPFDGSALRKRIYKPYFCSVCHLRYSRKERMEMHKKLHHQNKTDFCCTSCNCYFQNARILEKHLAERCMKNTEKPFQCRFCDKKYFSERNFIYHERAKHYRMMTSDELATPFIGLKCKCGKYFGTPMRLAKHRLRIHNAPKRCKLCNNSFRRLDRHLLSCKWNISHDQPRDEPTKIELFKSKVKVKVVEPHCCSFCRKQFTTKWWRDVHERRGICDDSGNSGDHKPRNSGDTSLKKSEVFECKLCQQVFTRKDKRDNHEKNKTCTIKKLTYSCDICYKDFSTKWYLTRHKKSGKNCKIPLADLSSDPCPGCNEKFESEVFLKRHLKYCAFL